MPSSSNLAVLEERGESLEVIVPGGLCLGIQKPTVLGVRPNRLSSSALPISIEGVCNPQAFGGRSIRRASISGSAL